MIKITIGLILALLGGAWYSNQDYQFGVSQKVSELTGYTSHISTDLLPIVDITNSTTKKTTLGSFFNFLVSTTTYMNGVQFVNATGTRIRVEDGSGTAPSYGFINDVSHNTGMYLGGQNTLSFTSGGTSISYIGTTGFRPNTDNSIPLGTASQRWSQFHSVLSTTTAATTTDLYVSNLASTTELRANVEVIGKSTIGNLTVTTCSGCSSGGAVNMYIASSTGGVQKFKQLGLVSGDVVVFEMQSSSAGNAAGSLHFRISSPWNMASTTCTDYSATVTAIPGNISCSFLATTTSTVTFGYVPATGATTYYHLWHSNVGYGNSF